MSQQFHRTQILLEPAQYATLAEMARAERRSLSALVRAIVQQEIERRARVADEVLRQRLEALDGVARHRAEILKRRGGRPIELDPTAAIREAREERDEEILVRVFSERR